MYNSTRCKIVSRMKEEDTSSNTDIATNAKRLHKPACESHAKLFCPNTSYNMTRIIRTIRKQQQMPIEFSIITLLSCMTECMNQLLNIMRIYTHLFSITIKMAPLRKRDVL